MGEIEGYNQQPNLSTEGKERVQEDFVFLDFLPTQIDEEPMFCDLNARDGVPIDSKHSPFRLSAPKDARPSFNIFRTRP